MIAILRRSVVVGITLLTLFVVAGSAAPAAVQTGTVTLQTHV